MKPPLHSELSEFHRSFFEDCFQQTWLPAVADCFPRTRHVSGLHCTPSPSAPSLVWEAVPLTWVEGGRGKRKHRQYRHLPSWLPSHVLGLLPRIIGCISSSTSLNVTFAYLAQTGFSGMMCNLTGWACKWDNKYNLGSVDRSRLEHPVNTFL